MDEDRSPQVPPLVDVPWLREHLDSAVLAVEVGVDASAYYAGHVPGAVAISWLDELHEPDRRGLPSQDRGERPLGYLGVSPDTHLVLYGEEDNRYAGYAYWVLRSSGHQRLALLDGGRGAWLASGSPVTEQRVDVVATRYVSAGRDESVRVSRDTLLTTYVGAPAGTALIDCRTRTEHRGREGCVIDLPVMRQRLRGHIPGATNHDHADLLEPGTDRSRPREELLRVPGCRGSVASGRTTASSTTTTPVTEALWDGLSCINCPSSHGYATTTAAGPSKGAWSERRSTADPATTCWHRGVAPVGRHAQTTGGCSGSHPVRRGPVRPSGDAGRRGAGWSGGRAVPDVTRSAVEGLSVVEDRQPVRVVLTALPPIYRHGLSAGLLAAGMDCTPVGSSNDLPGLFADRPPRATPEGYGAVVVVVPAEQALDVLTALREVPGGEAPTVHVVEEATVEACAEALRVGATGVVALDAELNQVVGVVRAAAGGQTLLPRQIAKALCRQQAGPVPQLMPREREWLRHLADSGTVASLARTVGYSEREMYRLLGGVYARLGASNRTEALLLAERWGLLEGEAP